MYRKGERETCATCGLSLTSLSALPAAQGDEEDDWPRRPEDEKLPLGFVKRGRGVLMLASLVGLTSFVLPWIHVTVPDVETLSGYAVARVLGWPWACGVAWGILLPTVVSRRSIGKMRGARVAAALFCAIPLITAAIIMLNPPRGGIVPLRFNYGIGIYLNLAVAALALPFAIGFGGRIDDLPMPRGSGAGEDLN